MTRILIMLGLCCIFHNRTHCIKYLSQFKGIWRFSNWRCSPRIRLTDDFTRATHTGEDGFQVVLCASAPALTVAFRVQVVRNPKGTGISIGMTAPDAFPNTGASELSHFTLDDQRFRNASWLLPTGQREYYARGQLAALNERAFVVREGSVVTVEKDGAQKALRFLVDGEELIEWRPTGLSSHKFAALVGCVRMRWTNDEVLIQDIM